LRIAGTSLNRNANVADVQENGGIQVRDLHLCRDISMTHLAAPPAKTLACVTMVYNESDMLPLWLRHYGGQVGASACYVVDHGTTDGSTDAIGGANRIRVPRTALDNPRRAAFIGEFCASLLRWYDYVLYTDSDELLVADPARYRSLLDYVSAPRAPVTTAFGLNLLHRLHHEGPIDTDRPILMQRSWAFPTSSMCKPLLIREPVEWSPGFHSSKAPIVFDGLFLFHLAYFDLRTALRRQEKRRRTTFKDATTAVHHRVDDDTVQGWMEGWSRMPPINDVTLDADCNQMADFQQRVIQSARGREKHMFGIDLNLTGNRLWAVPERFAASA